MDSNCIFCKIVKGELPAKIIAQNEKFIAFEDIHPVAPVHLLIIPKAHIPSVKELEGKWGEVMGGATELANSLAKKFSVGESGFRLVVNTGKESGQTVFHLHMHLLAGRQLDWPPG